MVELVLVFWLLVILCIGCLIADYIFPHISFIERYLDSLPMMLDEGDEEEKETDILMKEDIA